MARHMRVLMHALRLGEGRCMHLGGNFFHVAHLAQAIVVRDDVELTVLADWASYEPLCDLIGQKRVLLAGPHERNGLSLVASERAVLRACKMLSPHVYHRPTGQLPMRRLRCATVATVADLNFRTLNTTFLKRVYKELSYRWTFHTATRISAVSAFTRSEIVRCMGVQPARVTVVHHGANPLPPPAERVEQARHGPFWLTFGHQAHKNVEVCMRALRERRARGSNDRLVVVGRSDHIDDVLRPLSVQLGLGASVDFFGRVSPADLHWLYLNANGLLFMSRYEGFGLPILEAMRAGCPVICSNVCSLPEIAGRGAALVAPDDVSGLEAEMARIVSDRGHRDGLISAGREQAKKFTWERAAAETCALYRDAYSEWSYPETCSDC